MTTYTYKYIGETPAEFPTLATGGTLEKGDTFESTEKIKHPLLKQVGGGKPKRKTKRAESKGADELVANAPKSEDSGGEE